MDGRHHRLCVERAGRRQLSRRETRESGAHRGLLLPQVATEYNWDRETFLAHTCVKAGLPPDAWQTGARIFTFEAQVFSEQPSR